MCSSSFLTRAVKMETAGSYYGPSTPTAAADIQELDHLRMMLSTAAPVNQRREVF